MGGPAAGVGINRIRVRKPEAVCGQECRKNS